MSTDVRRVQALADAIGAGDKDRIDALASELGLRVEWHGALLRLQRGTRSVVCSMQMPRDQLEREMRVLFGRIWAVASR